MNRDNGVGRHITVSLADGKHRVVGQCYGNLAIWNSAEGKWSVVYRGNGAHIVTVTYPGRVPPNALVDAVKSIKRYYENVPCNGLEPDNPAYQKWRNSLIPAMQLWSTYLREDMREAVAALTNNRRS